ncbi:MULTISPECIES: ABC transporter ATP-binding protein [Halomonas]|jgi:branched-chain amino acid transport system ATP-binding protein|uniref:ABC transporter ATP-binding protein n=1 Tax=Halomonadaceae TaxID=28256 RepID=UPI0005CBAB84|nr:MULTISPECIES: ABC transporter ATP-binding protein [Halomonas]HAV43723.1 ABC transporter ATP-binding protein [Halomonas sp.]KJD18124.1 branched-chain amino acid ABC transporter substrate-binding protein [Halomonas meridiana]MCG7576472.1 ABC transporter ATP-binding protein [Halomonas sp. MMH1-48]MCG7603535.1 ABC transporter ATP-binding protein [Halomonas sp. MM17-34]MCG7612785.1 ABC transporter ATP-binding protein [Halomonas sp. MM17-29]|tara:strand:+ start:4395 stop:5162 length:768 start_codon:yes stop_codon:yes gene_type:complete
MSDDIVLATQGLTRRFGGLVAVNDVNFDVKAHEIHAILGPNGAGKSTLINLLSGEIPPSEGQVLYRQKAIQGKSARQIARLGIGRSHQKTNIFPRLSCLQNCELAARIHMGGVLGSWRSRHTAQQVSERAQEVLETCQLNHRAHTTAADMSYGEQRQLQIAMVLATAPSLMLLDEPMAGMGREETAQVTELLASLTDRYTLVLIEHDMDSVFRLANRITVMVDGCVLESGPTEQIRTSDKVRDVYLGRHDEGVTA